MKKRITILCLLILNIIQLYSQEQPYDTDNNGFINISTLSHLRWLSENPEGWNDNYELDYDINAAATKEWNDGKGFSPIGNNDINFRGDFKHNGFVIDSLSINRPDDLYIGLFGYINSTRITEVKLTNCNIIGKEYVGGVVGYTKSVLINNSYASGIINGKKYVGSIAGFNSGSVLSSEATGKVEGEFYIGGLIGYSSTSFFVSNCNFSGQVKGIDFVGGMIGRSHSTKISNCYSNGISTGRRNIGGFIGLSESNNSIIRNCFSNCIVTGETLVAGFIAKSECNIYFCYSTGEVSGDDEIGGFVYENTGNIYNCFWNKESSGVQTSDGAKAISENEMKSKNTFFDEGWNFDFIWKIDNGYPYINIDFSYRPTDENNNGFIDIHTMDDLKWFSENAQDFNFNIELMNNINASETYKWNNGRGFLPIGLLTFGYNGSMYGNGFFIDSLYINRPSENYIGLFSQVYGYEEYIRDLSIINCDIQGFSYTGGLIGKISQSKIINCSVKGVIIGNNLVGGLCGEGSGDITNSHAICSVSGKNNVGGFVGRYAVSTMLDCYSLSEIECINDGEIAAGLVGTLWSESSIINCFSAGKIKGTNNTGGLIGEKYLSEVINSFWDIEKSGVTNSDGGIGITTNELKKKETFINRNWDFDNIWDINENINDGYPFLKSYDFFSLFEVPTDDDNDEFLNLRTLKNLRWISLYPITWSYKYELDNNIDASDTKNWNNGYGWKPIGIYSNNFKKPGFSGEFNGNNFIIKEVYIKRINRDFNGLFGFIYNSTGIYNLNLSEFEIYGRAYCGILAGLIYTNRDIDCNYSNINVDGKIEAGGSGGLCAELSSKENKIIIHNIESKVSIKGSQSGGLIGVLSNSKDTLVLDECYSDGSVSGDSNIGGLIGRIVMNDENSNIIIRNSSSKCNVNSVFCGGCFIGGIYLLNFNSTVLVEDCFSKGNISGNGYTGGFLGYNSIEKSILKIKNCYSFNQSIQAEKQTGGFIGYNICKSGNITVESSFSLSSIKSEQQVGGFIGVNYSDNGGNINIKNCYSRGDVSGNTIVGGFCGENNTAGAGSVSIIENCYSTGKVESSVSKGGFCGLQINKGTSEINNCYWDLETSETDKSDGGEGRLTSNMKFQQTFKYWDFDNIWNITPGINDGYPHLQGMPTSVNNYLTFVNKTEYEIYPNPVNDYLKISRIYESNSISELIIYDLSGNKIYQDRIVDEQTLNLSSLKSGFYILKIDNSVLKFIKK